MNNPMIDVRTSVTLETTLIDNGGLTIVPIIVYAGSDSGL